MSANLSGQEQWERRGENEARIRSLENLLVERLTVYADTNGSGWSPGTSYANTNNTVTLPAGKWTIEATGWFDWSEGTARRKSAQIWNTTANTEVTASDTNTGATSGQATFYLFSTLTLTATTTFDLRAKVGAVDGAQLLHVPQLWARPVSQFL